MQTRLPRLLLVLGWFFLFLAAIGLVGHTLRPDTADTPEFGKYGGWILDVMSLVVGVAALAVRNRLAQNANSSGRHDS
jgi:hypothetical protein